MTKNVLRHNVVIAASLQQTQLSVRYVEEERLEEFEDDPDGPPERIPSAEERRELLRHDQVHSGAVCSVSGTPPPHGVGCRLLGGDISQLARNADQSAYLIYTMGFPSDSCLRVGDTTARECGPATAETPSAGRREPSPRHSEARDAAPIGGMQAGNAPGMETVPAERTKMVHRHVDKKTLPGVARVGLLAAALLPGRVAKQLAAASRAAHRR